MSLYSFKVEQGDRGLRLDVFLVRRLPTLSTEGLSRSWVQRMIDEGQVRLNGAQAKASRRLRHDDIVEVEWRPPREARLEAEALSLDIIHEDQDCIVINKPPGLVVHPAAGNVHGTLVNALLYHCLDLRGIGGEKRPGIIHRLDKNTSGVMVIAKNAKAFKRLAEQFKRRTVRKEYLALVWGKPEQPKGVIDRPIGRHRTDRKKMSSRHTGARARGAVTEWQVEATFRTGADRSPLVWVSLLRLMPHTGRTHQIRVHLADEKLPIVGDPTYGLRRSAFSSLRGTGPDAAGLTGFPRQALHAEKLGFIHPVSGKSITFRAPLYDDMEKLLAQLRAMNRVECVEKNEGGLTTELLFPKLAR